MRRELELVLRCRATWLVVALAALLIGHGFVLALDVFAATSRSALASTFQARDIDPLLGVVRPTLSGVSFALGVLGPVVAARPLAIEKERNTYGAHCLAVGSTERVVLTKLSSAAVACSLLLAPAVVLLLGFVAIGGHIDGIEAGVALAGEVLHLGVVAAASVAAAAWTRSLAQAVTVALMLSVSAWALDAADGFAALSWLGGASAWSIDQRLEPFGRGVIALSSISWLLTVVGIFVLLALLGGRFSRPTAKSVLACAVAAIGLVVLAVTPRVGPAFDWSEQRRASLPPAVVDGLRRIDQPMAIEVLLDRDDSRRRQLERETLTKLGLALPKLAVVWPLDDTTDVAEGHRDVDYGTIRVRVGSATRATRSTNGRELVTLLFDAAGSKTPTWDQSPYPGFPFVPARGARRVMLFLAYFGLPFTIAGIGLAFTYRRIVR